MPALKSFILKYFLKSQEDVNCWHFGPVFVKQFSDGMVVVERTGQDGSRVKLRTSPGNGRLRFESNLVQVGDGGRRGNCFYFLLLLLGHRQSW